MNICVSVIVPVYNTEKYLYRCLESLVNQTLKEIEIILVNDCSTDGSLTILEEYQSKYKEKIILINLNEKKGCGGARNIGMKAAKGKYIGFVDADDDISLDMYKILYRIAERGNYDMVDCKFFNEYLNENIISTCKEALGILNIEKRRAIISSPGYVWSKIIKRSILIDNYIKFRENVAYEDFEFIPTVVLFCQKVCTTNKVLYNYRYNELSITNNYKRSVHIDDKIVAMKELVNVFKELNQYNNYRDEITYLIYLTYSNMIQAALVLEQEKIDIDLFKKMHDFFFEVVDYDYSNNKYIADMSRKDKLFAEVNNKDYKAILNNCSDLLDIK